MIRHTADITDREETLLIEYAFGTLDEAHSLLIASYISRSPQARERVRACEIVGGMLMESCCAPESMTQKNAEHILEKLGAVTENPPPAQDKEDNAPLETFGDNDIPAPIMAYMRRQQKKAKWRKLLNGCRICRLSLRGSQYNFALYDIAPGHGMPTHTHKGAELTLVLEGSFSDEYGQYDAGKLVIHETGTTHTPQAHPETGCICVILTEGPYRFSNPLVQLLSFLR